MASRFDRLQSELAACQRVTGVTPASLLALPPELRRLLNAVTRQGEMSLQEIASQLDTQPTQARGLLDTLVDKGYLRAVEAGGATRYKTSLGHKRARKTPSHIWAALGDKAE
jgi:predicted ArsR family transcriptional regulator